MAYTLKYTSNFYNRYGKYVEVEISKQDYVGAVTALRNTEVYIEVNFQDNNTSIIGTGCSIVVINQGEFIDLEDLLTTMEKQFKVVVKYNSATVFQGFSICDLNEQQFNKLSRIKLQFTDYLRRLEGYFAANFFVGSNTDLLTILQELIVTVGFGAAYQLYVNSTLFESHMNTADSDTFLKQTYVENNMFFSDANTYDNVYEMNNRTLRSFGCFLYSAGDKWILERQEDTLRDTAWVVYTLYQVGSTTPNLRQLYNKQDGDFAYADESQILEYASGLRTLIVNLKDKQYDTFVFNDYSIYNPASENAVTMDSVSDTTPEPGTLQLRTWYKYVDILILQAGFDYKGIGSFIKWSYPQTLNDASAFAFMGLYYAFKVQFTKNAEEPIILNINYKMAGEISMIPAQRVIINFLLRVDGGTYDGYYLTELGVPPNGTIISVLLSTFVVEAFNTTEVDVSTSAEQVWSVSKSFNLTDSYSEDGITFRSIWDLLGNPDSQTFMIYFYPTIVYFKGDPSPFRYSRINYLGDVSVTITQQKIVNKITYYVNEDFVRTEDVDIDFYDEPNVNFANGLMYGLGGIGNDAIDKTSETWTSDRTPSPDALIDIYASNKFRNYARTIHKLKAKILHDGYMKPFSVLTDDQKSGIYFLLQSYTWDLFNGSYDIVAEEYTTEDIVIDDAGAAGGASSGGGGGDPGILPPAPTGLLAEQGTPGLFIGITWDDAVGATGYILQRRGYWNGIDWVDSWKTIFEGDPGFFFNAAYDNIQLEAVPLDGTVFYYRVASKTALFYGAYSAETSVTWYN